MDIQGPRNVGKGITRRKLLGRGAAGGGALLLAPWVMSACAAPATSPGTSVPGASGVGADTPRRGGILRIGLGGNIPDFDVQQSATYRNQHPISPFYNLLVQPTDNMLGVAPDLAESWTTSTDGKTVTFKLRQNVKWHNGDVFTSEDAKFSLQRMISPPTGILAPRRAQLSNIRSMETPDPNTLVLRLGNPQPEIFAQIANGYNPIYNKKFTEPLDAAGEGMKRKIMGTGPFKLKNFVEGQILEMERNPDYFIKEQPYLDGIQYFFIAGEPQVAAALESGRIDGFFLINNPSLTDSLKAKGFKARNRAGINTNVLLINTTRKPFDDIRIRQALSLSFDRTAYLKVVGPLTGNGLFSRGILPPGSGYDLTKEQMAAIGGGGDTYPDGGGNAEVNRTRAKALLASAGASNLKVVVPSRGDIPANRDGAIAIAEHLKAGGFAAEVRVMEEGAFEDALVKKEFDVALRSLTSTLPVADQVLSFWVSTSGQNYSGFKDEAIDDLYVRQSQELDPTKRKALIEEFQLKAMRNFNIVPLTWATLGYAHITKLEGWPEHDFGFNAHMRMDRAWLRP